LEEKLGEARARHETADAQLEDARRELEQVRRSSPSRTPGTSDEPTVTKQALRSSRVGRLHYHPPATYFPLMPCSSRQ
jgi:hypothetical protein